MDCAPEQWYEPWTMSDRSAFPAFQRPLFEAQGSLQGRSLGEQGRARPTPSEGIARRGSIDQRAFMAGFPPTPPVVKQDAVEWLASLPSASVDLIVTDPAYESLEKHRARGTTTRLKHSKASSNAWFQIFPNQRFHELLREAYRVLKNNRHFYLFTDQETMFVTKPIAEDVGFRFWKPLVWDKQKIGMGYHYRARYELILFFEKGKRKLHDLSIPDIISFPRIHGGYPAEKPPEVAQVLIEQSTSRDELVIDPFCGSGSVGVAALRLGRRFYGSDLCQEAVDLSLERILATDSPVAVARPAASDGATALVAGKDEAEPHTGHRTASRS